MCLMFLDLLLYSSYKIFSTSCLNLYLYSFSGWTGLRAYERLHKNVLQTAAVPQASPPKDSGLSRLFLKLYKQLYLTS